MARIKITTTKKNVRVDAPLSLTYWILTTLHILFISSISVRYQQKGGGRKGELSSGCSNKSQDRW